ncbi:hypothetical protein D3C83_178630 [compost metagenome]
MLAARVLAGVLIGRGGGDGGDGGRRIGRLAAAGEAEAETDEEGERDGVVVVHGASLDQLQVASPAFQG